MTKVGHTELFETSIKSKDERNAQLQLDNEKLKKALASIVKISDRQHAAWDIAKDLLSTTTQPESQPESDPDWEGFESHWESKPPVVRNYQTVQKPLSDEEIIEIKFKEGLGNWFNFARAIEKAHGIN